MGTCDYCGEEIKHPFSCNYCEGSFCKKHRLPPNHECPELASWKSRSGSSIGSPEKKESWISKKKELIFQNFSLPLSSDGKKENAEEEDKKESIGTDSSKNRIKGEVKFYNQSKNYGFIIPKGGGEDVYFKGRDVIKGRLDGGETVEFTRVSEDENPRAIDIVKKETKLGRLKDWLFGGGMELGKFGKKFLNLQKYLGGLLFALGCFIGWISFFGVENLSDMVPSQIIEAIHYLIPTSILSPASTWSLNFFSNPVSAWSNGAWLTIFGFLLFFSAWIVSKIRSKYGHRYWDRKASGIAKKMGEIYALTIVFWIISIMFLKTDASFAILENSWPQRWITGFLFTLILMGLYMNRIRANRRGGRSLPSKIKSGLGGIFAFILSIAVIVGAGFIVWTVWIHPWLSTAGVTSWEYMPANYYEEANKYVNYKYGNVPNQDRADLKNFLLKIDTFPPYDWEIFTCSEASARLEWLLEGAGFDVSIATSKMGPDEMGHAWTIVELSKVNNVKVEATYFTEDHYNPPGIVQGHQALIGATVNYDEPEEIYKNPEEAMKGAVIIPKSGWDWWNVSPYSETAPFSEWD